MHKCRHDYPSANDTITKKSVIIAISYNRYHDHMYKEYTCNKVTCNFNVFLARHKY